MEITSVSLSCVTHNTLMYAYITFYACITYHFLICIIYNYNLSNYIGRLVFK